MSDLKEKIARQLCADGGSSGFCSCVGGSLGCKVGRGELFNGSNCAASSDQLKLRGYVEIADRILAIPEIAEALLLMDTARRRFGAAARQASPADLSAYYSLQNAHPWANLLRPEDYKP